MSDLTSINGALTGRSAAVSRADHVSRLASSEVEIKSAPGRTADSVELSAAAIEIAEARAPKASGVRTELVERIRQQIADGTYETPEKTAIATLRFAEALGVRA